MKDPKEVEIQAKLDKCKKETGELQEVFNKNMSLIQEYQVAMNEVIQWSEQITPHVVRVKQLSDLQPKLKKLVKEPKKLDALMMMCTISEARSTTIQKALNKWKKIWDSIVAKIDTAYPDPVQASNSLTAKSNQIRVELDSVKQLLASLNQSSMDNFVSRNITCEVDKVTGNITHIEMDKETVAIFTKQVTMQTISELTQREIITSLDLCRTHFTKGMPLLPQNTRVDISNRILRAEALIKDSATALASFKAALNECLKKQNMSKSTDPKIAVLYSSTSPALLKQPSTQLPDGKRESNEPEKITNKMSSLTLGGTP